MSQNINRFELVLRTVDIRTDFTMTNHVQLRQWCVCQLLVHPTVLRRYILISHDSWFALKALLLCHSYTSGLLCRGWWAR